jgi:hypothetical protein
LRLLPSREKILEEAMFRCKSKICAKKAFGNFAALLFAGRFENNCLRSRVRVQALRSVDVLLPPHTLKERLVFGIYSSIFILTSILQASRVYRCYE